MAHVCNCDDCHQQAYADRCQYEDELRKLVETAMAMLPALHPSTAATHRDAVNRARAVLNQPPWHGGDARGDSTGS